MQGEFDTSERFHGAFPALRIALGGMNYYPPPAEIRELSYANYVTWPNFVARFPEYKSRWLTAFCDELGVAD